MNIRLGLAVIASLSNLALIQTDSPPVGQPEYIALQPPVLAQPHELPPAPPKPAIQPAPVQAPVKAPVEAKPPAQAVAAPTEPATVAEPAAPPERLYNSFNVVQLIENDVVGVAALNDTWLTPKYIRYLAFNNYPTVALRDRRKLTIDWVLNSLSRNREIPRAAWIDPDHVVLRVNLRDYGMEPKDWDFLAENGSGLVPLGDPYFHERQYKVEEAFEVKEDYVWGDDGKAIWDPKINDYKKQKVRVKVGEKGKGTVVTNGQWLAIEQKLEERGQTYGKIVTALQTQNPILRADWFAAYASWAPAYYRFLGLDPDKGTEADIDKLAKFDIKLAERSLIAAVSDTRIVTLHNRVLHRYPTAQGYTGGYIWKSQDTNRGIDAEDYLANIQDFRTPKVQAREIIFTLLNTLQGYAVVNGEGKLQNKADESIAIHGDRMPTRLQAKTVFTGLRNCALCHNGGIIPIDDNVRALASGNFGAFVLDHCARHPVAKTWDKDKQLELQRAFREAFSPGLADVVQHDSAIHTAAIAAVNGLKPAQNAAFFEDMLVEYLEAPITLAVAASEAGVSPAVLEKALKKGKNLDYQLTSLLAGRPVARVAWERTGYAAMMNYLLAVKEE